jgi:hypothetical protein
MTPPGDDLVTIRLEVRVVQTRGRAVKPERIAAAVADRFRGELVEVPSGAARPAVVAVLAAEPIGES